jgi:alpha-L-arabinofuranosidase
MPSDPVFPRGVQPSSYLWIGWGGCRFTAGQEAGLCGGRRQISRPLPGGVLASALVAAACGVADPSGPPEDPPRPDLPFVAEIRIGAPGREVNRLILGTNIQWVDLGDDLLEPNGSFDPSMLTQVDLLEPTVVRYPGGSQSDTYDWTTGMGPQSERGFSEHFNRGETQRVLFGTPELLELTTRLGAAPLITVNTTTDTPEQAAAWVRAVNLPSEGGSPRTVHFWEVGNEPYLVDDARPELAVEPNAFAARADSFIRAMRNADPSISIGLPLRSDRFGDVPAVFFPGYQETVLSQVREPFDFAAVHDAYFPFLIDTGRSYSTEDLFSATMAAYRIVEEDLQNTRTMLDRYQGGRPIPFAITEYNAFFSIGGQADLFIATLGGALYVADILRVFATRDDILMANFWSLSGNWVFGALSGGAQPRPAYRVLRAYDQVMHGQILGLDVESPTFDSPAVGAVRAATGLPLVTAVGTADGARTRLLILNKSATRGAQFTISGPTGSAGSLSVQLLSADNVFDPAQVSAGVDWQQVSVQDVSFPLHIDAPAHSLLWIEYDSP